MIQVRTKAPEPFRPCLTKAAASSNGRGRADGRSGSGSGDGGSGREGLTGDVSEEEMLALFTSIDVDGSGAYG